MNTNGVAVVSVHSMAQVLQVHINHPSFFAIFTWYERSLLVLMNYDISP